MKSFLLFIAVTIPIYSSYGQGAYLVKDVFVGSQSSYNSYLHKATIEYNGVLFFTANDGTAGYELWRSDGTFSGTYMVKDIWPGIQSSQPNNFIEFNGLLYFQATSPTTGAELWKTDGSSVGTILVSDIEPGFNGSQPENFVILGNKLFFKGVTLTHGFEIMVYDLVANNTSLFTEYVLGSSSSNPAVLVSSGGMLFFSEEIPGYGHELLVSDGISSHIIEDINQGSNSSINIYYKDACFFNNKLLITANNGTSHFELFQTDGLTFELVKDISPAGSSIPSEFCLVDSVVYFSAWGQPEGIELWRTNGSSQGTYLVTDINSSASNQHSEPINLISFNHELLFTASNGINGKELWKSNGTSTGTVLVKDINTGSGDSNINELTVYGSKVYFEATDSINGSELWSSDGTELGTAIVADLYPGSQSGSAKRITHAGGKLFFFADDGTSGMELWAYNPPLNNPEYKVNRSHYYPNPTNGILHLELESEGLVIITDLLGNVIFIRRVQPNEDVLDISHLAEGLYIVYKDDECLGKVLKHRF